MFQLAILDHLNTKKVTRIAIRLKNGNTERIDCVAKLIDEKTIEAKFLAEDLSVGNIDLQEPCIIYLDAGGPILAAKLIIAEVVNTELLRLKVNDVQLFQQKRNYFRVNTTLSLLCTYFPAKGLRKEIRLDNESVNISGNGILFPAPEAPKLDTKVKIELELPDGKVILRGAVKRIEENMLGNCRIAIQFKDVEPVIEQRLMHYCNIVQRKEISKTVVLKNEID